MNKVVIIIMNNSESELYYAVASEFVRREFLVEFVTTSRQVESFMHRHNMNTLNIEREVGKIVRDANFTEADVATLEQKYSTSLGILARADPRLRNKKATYQKMRTMAYLSAWESYLHKAAPFLIINMDGRELLKLSCDCVARRNGIHILHTNGIGLIPDTMYWSKGIWMNDWVKKEYLLQEPTADELAKVIQYIDSMKQTKPILYADPKKLALGKLIKNFIAHTYSYISIEKGSYPGHNPFRMLRSFTVEQVTKRNARRYYTPSDFSRKHIFVPLHVPDDAQILVRAYHFYHQERFVELCARNAPDGYSLYVKEHPHGKGMIPLKALKRMLSFPNVRLIPPEVNAHDLVRNSQCVIVINSDVGWEALLYGKPVVVLEKPFYYDCGLTFDVHTINELPGKIEEALASGPIEQDKIYRMVNTVMKSLYPCSYYSRNLIPNLAPDNIGRIVDSILIELEVRGA